MKHIFEKKIALYFDAIKVYFRLKALDIPYIERCK